jgi:hypothetical protein
MAFPVLFLFLGGFGLAFDHQVGAVEVDLKVPGVNPRYLHRGARSFRHCESKRQAES